MCVCVCGRASKEEENVIHRTYTTAVFIYLEICFVDKDGLELLTLLPPLWNAGITSVCNCPVYGG